MQSDKTFSTRFGVIAATVGSAVGLGNIWRFPYECGANGGSAFLLAYIGFVIVLGIPVICAEFVVGRASGTNVAGAFRKLGAGRLWQSIGVMGITASFFIMGFYSVVAGWCMDYIWQSATGFGGVASQTELHTRFDEIVASPLRPVAWTIAFLVVNFMVISRGVQKGIERISNLLMPLLFVILAVFCVNSLLMPGAAEGMSFLFKPDFSKLDGDALLSAMGQAFFSLSVGMGALITYSSYFSKKTSLVKTAGITAALDTLVAVMAAIVIFPACFSFGQEPAAGPRLVFEVLPSIFMSLPGGQIWGTLFFILLFVASLTSTISLSEVVIACMEGEWKMSRGKATLIEGAAVTVMAVLSSLSFGALSGWTIFGMNFFNLLDFLSSNILLPAGGVLISIYVGWVLDRRIVSRQLTPPGHTRSVWVAPVSFCLRFIAPPAILAIFIFGLL